ncbi:unnamed protein product, partial [Prorocentrum cordatum]
PEFNTRVNFNIKVEFNMQVEFDTMEQIVQQLQATLERQQQDIQLLRQQLAAEQAKTSVIERLATSIDKMAANSGSSSLVDTKGIGKPTTFGGGDEKDLEKKFGVWQRRTQNFIVSVHPSLDDVMEWAIENKETITNDILLQAFGDDADPANKIDDILEKPHQVYSMLVQITEGEANDIVCNSGSNGMEAWRKLSRRFDPLTGGRVRNLLRQIISPGRCSVDVIAGGLERWEELVTKYDRSNTSRGEARTLPEDIKMAALESLVPQELETHLQLNATRFDTYMDMRTEIVRYVEARLGAKIRGPQVQQHDRHRDRGSDMDVDMGSLQRHPKGKDGKGNSGKGFDGYCFNCGGWGHRSSDCRRAPQDGKGRGGKSDPKGKGRDSKGKDTKGKARGSGAHETGAFELCTLDLCPLTSITSDDFDEHGNPRDTDLATELDHIPDLGLTMDTGQACEMDDIPDLGLTMDTGQACEMDDILDLGLIMDTDLTRELDDIPDLGLIVETDLACEMDHLPEQGAILELDVTSEPDEIVELDIIIEMALTSETDEITELYVTMALDLDTVELRKPELEVNSVDMNSFKTASGEVVDDEGPFQFLGYSLNGQLFRLNGRLADIHKPLVSAGKVTENCMIILKEHTGHVIPRTSNLAKKINEVIQNELEASPKQELLKLKNELWKFNLDTGAACTVFPTKWAKPDDDASRSKRELAPMEVVGGDPESTEAIPEIVTDYFYMGEEEKAATHVFIKDRVTSMIGAAVLDGKTSTYAAKYFTNFLVELGYRRIILKSDNEPALLKLRREAVKDMQIEVVPRESPVSDHQANGAAESGVREAKKGIRALKTSTEDRYGRKLAEDHVLLAWLARHVVQTSNRYKVGEDGRTPVQRSTGRRWKKPALLFGECIMARLAVTRAGIMIPGAAGAQEGLKRDVYIAAKMTEKYGLTPECPACTEIFFGGSTRQGHAPTCRSRIVEAMEKDPDGRLRLAAARKRKKASTAAPDAKQESEVEDAVREKPEEEQEEVDMTVGEGDHMQVVKPERNMKCDIGSLSEQDSQRAQDQRARKRGAMAGTSGISEKSAPAVGQARNADVGAFSAYKDKYFAETFKHVTEFYTGSEFEGDGIRGGIPDSSRDVRNGFAIDLRLQRPDGQFWDLSRDEDIDMLDKLQDKYKPEVLIGCPSSTVFSRLRSPSRVNLGPNTVSLEMQDGRRHLRASVDAYRKQIKMGKLFLHEVPGITTSRDEDIMAELENMPGVYMDERVSLQGKSGWYRHVRPVGFQKVRSTQIYPPRLMYAILRVVRDQLVHRMELSSMDICTAGPIADEPEVYSDEQWKTYYDDVNGGIPPTKLVEDASQLERDWVAKEGVYTKVPREVMESEGATAIPLLWIDTNKGDANKPVVRSRLVVMEAAKGKKAKFEQLSPEKLFSAMPWLEALKLLCIIQATQQRSSRGAELKLAFWDISRAHFTSKCERRLFVKLPEGDPDRHTHVGLLQRTMYGTQDASHLWQKNYTDLLAKKGYVPGKTNPSIFYNPFDGSRLFVHGDDFVLLGDQRSITEMDTLLDFKFTCKHVATLGTEAGDSQDACILNRIVRITEDGIEIEGDRRHAELLARDLGLEEAKSVDTPRVKHSESDVWKGADSRVLSSSEATLYRSCVMRASYLGQDRLDIQEAVKCLAQSMKSPNEFNLQEPKRLGRYVLGRPRAILKFPKQAMPNSAHALGIKSLMADWGLSSAIRLNVKTDCAAAKGFATRRGLGKQRHVNTRYLWLQDRVASGDIRIVKVRTTEQMADPLTKAMAVGMRDPLLTTAGLVFDSSRAVTQKGLLA